MHYMQVLAFYAEDKACAAIMGHIPSLLTSLCLAASVPELKKKAISALHQLLLQGSGSEHPGVQAYASEESGERTYAVFCLASQAANVEALSFAVQHASKQLEAGAGRGLHVVEYGAVLAKAATAGSGSSSSSKDFDNTGGFSVGRREAGRGGGNG